MAASYAMLMLGYSGKKLAVMRVMWNASFSILCRGCDGSFRASSGLRARSTLHAGAVVAASNAALALVQLGDEPAAIKEMQKASRRAPGSADLRAALAALYWSQVRAASATTTGWQAVHSDFTRHEGSKSASSAKGPAQLHDSHLCALLQARSRTPCNGKSVDLANGPVL